uniref:Protein kinase domain-containing protein n=1 Tax=Emiliania huxleyi TaxID=2903 RepID=A0A7S3X5W3_EMIHU
MAAILALAARRGTLCPRMCASDTGPLVIDGETFGVKGRLGSGHYGSVLLGESARHGSVAVKLGIDLTHEAAVLRSLGTAAGFAPAIYHAQSDAIVMELLGPSVQTLWETTTSMTFFSGPTVLRLGRGMMRCLRALHEAGWAHNDVKPANFLRGASGSELHLIDFGLASRIGAGDRAVGEVGTPLFASFAGQTGSRPTRGVDDLESLVYCLTFLASGGLPWERKSHARTAFMKGRMLTDEGCELLTDSCAASGLTDDIPSPQLVEALQAVWAEVVACQEGQRINYEACLAALTDCGPADEV